ncbi:MAG: inositol monophosphatase family protein [Patescibacteria group bacterium]|jgi:myo-inositol-1(or 4)-monophosphatase
MNTQTFLDFGLQTVIKSRALIKQKSVTGFSVSIKDDDSPVTEVDRETEQLVRNEIEKKFPTHSIVGEEFGVINQNAEFKWYIDPIDGTISFSHGIPLYGTILALYQNDIPLVGIIDHPGLDLCYYAAKGLGTFCNETRITMKDIGSLSELSREIIATGDLKQFELSGTMDAYNNLLSKHQLVRTIPDCFGHTLAAKGAVGAMVDFHINDWDVAATQIIIEEAGGKFVTTKRTQSTDGKMKHNIICGKPKVVDYLTQIF